jgi:predicted DNA-binding transcriptional regulator AlpA
MPSTQTGIVKQDRCDREAYSVVEFAQAYGLSRATVYNLWKDGIGPRPMRVGRRTLISKQAAAEWVRRMEQAAGAEAA